MVPIEKNRGRLVRVSLCLIIIVLQLKIISGIVTADGNRRRYAQKRIVAEASALSFLHKLSFFAHRSAVVKFRISAVCAVGQYIFSEKLVFHRITSYNTNIPHFIFTCNNYFIWRVLWNLIQKPCRSITPIQCLI